MDADTIGALWFFGIVFGFMGLMIVIGVIVTIVGERVKFREIQYDSKYNLIVKTKNMKYLVSSEKILRIDAKGKLTGEIGVERLELIDMVKKFGEFSVVSPNMKAREELNLSEVSETSKEKTDQIKVERKFKASEIKELIWITSTSENTKNNVIELIEIKKKTIVNR